PWRGAPARWRPCVGGRASRSRLREPCPEVVEHRRDRGGERGAAEVEGAGSEDLGAGARLVVRHLGGQTGPEQVRDLGEADRRGGHLLRSVVYLDAVPADRLPERRALLQFGSRPEPGGRRRVEQREQAL